MSILPIRNLTIARLRHHLLSSLRLRRPQSVAGQAVIPCKKPRLRQPDRVVIIHATQRSASSPCVKPADENACDAWSPKAWPYDTGLPATLPPLPDWSDHGKLPAPRPSDISGSAPVPADQVGRIVDELT